MVVLHKNIVLGFCAACLAVCIWSSWVVISSFGVRHSLSAWDITFIRFWTASVCVLPWVFWNFSRLRQIFTWQSLVCAMAGGFPYTMLSFLGLRVSMASNAAVIINGLMPVFVLIFSYFWLYEKISPHKYFAIALIGLANVLIFWNEEDAHFFGIILLIGASVCISLYTVFLRVWKIPPLDLLISMSLFNAFLFSPLWWMQQSTITIAPWSEILLQAFFQGIVVSLVALFLIAYSVKNLGTVTTGTLMGLVPIFASVLAVFVLGESFTGVILASVILCAIGIVLFNYRRRT